MFILWFPIPDQPPLYLGLYVDDFVYFSESSKVEKKFEHDFSQTMDMELNGLVSHFLGIKHTTTHHDNGHIMVKMSQEAFVDTL